MFKKIMFRLFSRQHFWRGVDFDELSEIYISMMFRGLSISLTGLFVPLYMLRLGYSVTSVLMVPMWYFIARALIFDVAAAYSVARIGPKHSMIFGNLLLIISTAMFLTLGYLHWPIAMLGIIWGGSASFFFIPFHVSFSKVKHKAHGGKELGYVNIMEKLGYAIGPIVGGGIATIFGAQYLFLLGAGLLMVALVPLFRSGEPTLRNQTLHWKSLDVAALKYDFMSYAALSTENSICIFVWPLYLGLFVLAGTAAYAELGLLSAVAVIGSITTAFAIGKLIDNKKGRSLLRFSAIFNAIVHIARSFVYSYGVAIALNLANESVTTGYRMPYTKGFYDAADDLPGYRIVYVASMELFGSFFKATLYGLLVILSLALSAHVVTATAFGIAAVASLIIMTERFRALD